ncbi:MAG: DUF2092 domain-containing protein [bacterium]|nr:DUF2092 domain-containing protein [bacterium]
MQTTLCLLLGLAFLAPEPAEKKPAPDGKSPEAVVILKKVDAAAKAVKAARYKASTKPEGAAVQFFPAAEGTVIHVGWTGSLPEKFHIQLESKTAQSEETRRVTCGGDGETFFLIDHQAKKAYEDMDPAVLGSASRMVRSFGMVEFVHPTPFSDELNAEKAVLLGTEKIDGQECDKVRVVYVGGQQESTWFFSQKDHLPRRRIQHFRTPQGQAGTLTVDVTNLETDPKLDADTFKFKKPDGFELVDDFAP